MSAPDRQTLALSLARRILTEALETQRSGDFFVKDLAGRIGHFRQAIRAAVTVMDAQFAGEAEIALSLARRILADAIAPTPPSLAIDRNYVRTLAERVGELQQAMRSAMTVMDELAGDDQ